jgi:hypothetical protein
MPKIGDAGGVNLSDIVHQLSLSTATGTKELRSGGTDLYVRDSAALFSSQSSRTAHRDHAVGLVRDGLAREYGLSKPAADTILGNVFGQAPREIHVADVKRLNSLGAMAQGMVDRNTDITTAFTLAQHAEALRASGVSGGDAEAAAREVKRRVDGGQDVGVARAGVGMAFRVLAGAADAPAANRGLDDAARAVFVDVLQLKASTLAPFNPAGGGDNPTWLKLGQAFGEEGFVPADQVKAMPLGQRASLLHAVSAEVIRCAGPDVDDLPGVTAAYKQVIQLNRALSVRDVLPQSEGVKRALFQGAVRNDETLRAAKANWAEMGSVGRRDAIAALIGHHAQAFGYTVAPGYLKLEAMGADEYGGFHRDHVTGTMSLTLNNTIPAFRDFNEVLDTVVHESTHRYQEQLVIDLGAGLITPAHDHYEQARVMAANKEAPVLESFLTDSLHLPGPFASAAYRQAPNELHAFYCGGLARHQLSSLLD